MHKVNYKHRLYIGQSRKNRVMPPDARHNLCRASRSDTVWLCNGLKNSQIKLGQKIKLKSIVLRFMFTIKLSAIIRNWCYSILSTTFGCREFESWFLSSFLRQFTESNRPKYAKSIFPLDPCTASLRDVFAKNTCNGLTNIKTKLNCEAEIRRSIRNLTKSKLSNGLILLFKALSIQLFNFRW